MQIKTSLALFSVELLFGWFGFLSWLVCGKHKENIAVKRERKRGFSDLN